MEHWCTLISFLSSQDLKEKILDQPDEACPTNIPAVLLAQFSDKQGEGATKDNLTGGVPRQAQGPPLPHSLVFSPGS